MYDISVESVFDACRNDIPVLMEAIRTILKDIP